MLLHFTGSGHFNRSMRNKADKMVSQTDRHQYNYIINFEIIFYFKGMSLSEHSFNAGVIRKVHYIYMYVGVVSCFH